MEALSLYFSPCQWNLIKRFQIESLIALITKKAFLFHQTCKIAFKKCFSQKFYKTKWHSSESHEVQSNSVNYVSWDFTTVGMLVSYLKKHRLKKNVMYSLTPFLSWIRNFMQYVHRFIQAKGKKQSSLQTAIFHILPLTFLILAI